MAEWGRLLICCTGNGTRGSNPRLSATTFADSNIMNEAPVAQLDRASVCGTEGQGFKSLRVYQLSLRKTCWKAAEKGGI